MPERTCAVCEDPIPAHKNANTKYCTRKCRDRAWYQKRKQTPKVDTCDLCNIEFEHNQTRQQQYCSRECAAFAMADTECEVPWSRCDHCGTWAVDQEQQSVLATILPCIECGGPIAATTPLRTHPVCAEKRKIRYDRKYNQQRPKVTSTPIWPDTCDECGSDYIGRAQNSRYCSRPCSRRQQKRRRRAAKAGSRSTSYARGDIFVRDGWECQLCGDKLDRRTKAPHPRSATIDHIVPISEGGDDAPENVQAAHFLCNSLKGTRAAGSQLRLVG